MDLANLHRAAKAHYWDERDLPTARRLLEQGIELARALDQPSEEKAMNYNLASFCWPGWDEEGIAPTEDDVAAGETAAGENLRLAQALGKGDGPLANAWFMVGAYHLARGRGGEAEAAFAQYAGAAERAGTRDAVLLAEGYRALAAGLPLDAAQAGLRAEGGANGDEFADQLATAARVFRSPEEPSSAESRSKGV